MVLPDSNKVKYLVYIITDSPSDEKFAINFLSKLVKADKSYPTTLLIEGGKLFNYSQTLQKS